MNYKIEPKPINSTFNDEQWQAIQLKGNNILISASAGSGKTTVLIERIFNHIMQGYANIDELLVVTFTEAAANEMKERMENRLKNAVNETTDPTEQGRLVEQLALLPSANIQTLHSFCLQVIQNFFYLIDFNPNFSLVTDQTQIQLMYQDVWDELVQNIFDIKKDSPVNQDQYNSLLSKYGNSRSDESLLNLIIELYLFARSQPEPKEWLKAAHIITVDFASFGQTRLFKQTIQPYIKNQAMDAIQQLTEAKSIMNSTSDDTMGKYDSVLTNDLDQASRLYELISRENLEDIFAAIDGLNFAKWPSNKKSSEDYEYVNEMKGLRDEAKASIESIKSLFNYDYSLTSEVEAKVNLDIQELCQLTEVFMDTLSKYKTHYSLIDYNDLEHLALQILAPYNDETHSRDLSSAALYYQAQFQEIMIDEYQDINDIQNSILYYLSHEGRPDLDNNLFMVGDVKQSIYGFRMAEPSLFLERYKKYQATDDGELIILDKNYRSRDEVLQFTNFVFERIMDEEFGELNYGVDESLTTGNHSFIPQAPDSKFNIQFKLYEKEEDNGFQDEKASSEENDELGLIDSSLEAQAHIVAQDIMSKIDGKFELYDKKLGAMRPATFSDFVILTPTRKPFLVTQRIFELYQIPMYAQKVENYFQRQEVQLMLALLKLIDNPLQDLPLVAILRSYFVQINDTDLSKIRIHTPHGLFYEAVLAYIEGEGLDTDLQQKLSAFISQLERWQDLAESASLVDLIWTIYQDTSFLDYVAGLSNGVQREANLHALYQKALDFEKSQFNGVFGFIQFIEKMMQQQNDLAEPVLLESDQNFVRLMTVHASKGLEFPVVYLMDTAKKFNLQDARTRPYIASKNYGLSSDYYDTEHWVRFRSFTKQAFKIEKENALKAEEMRKLYVALTRCEQKLIIVGVVKNQDSWFEKNEKIESKVSPDTLVLPQNTRQAGGSWLDWIQQALMVPKNSQSHASFESSQVDIDFISKEQLTDHNQLNNLDNQFIVHKNLNKEINKLDKESLQNTKIFNHLNKLFNHTYPYQLATRTSSYQSVSELKRLYEEPPIDKIDYFSDRRNLDQTMVEASEEDDSTSIQGIRYTADTFQEPTFMSEAQSKISYADIGSATHFVLQYLNFEALQDLDEEGIRHLIATNIESYVEEGYLSLELAHKINLDNIIHFIQSDIGQLTIENAQLIRREQAFSFLTPAVNLFEKNLTNVEVKELSDDQLLVHGVIDNFIEFEDRIVIFDYKTDRYKPYSNLTKEEQIEQVMAKYRFQISLYSKALETAFSKPVSKAYIVLLDFGQAIEVDSFYDI